MKLNHKIVIIDDKFDSRRLPCCQMFQSKVLVSEAFVWKNKSLCQMEETLGGNPDFFSVFRNFFLHLPFAQVRRFSDRSHASPPLVQFADPSSVVLALNVRKRNLDEQCRMGSRHLDARALRLEPDDGHWPFPPRFLARPSGRTVTSRPGCLNMTVAAEAEIGLPKRQ